jgi:hypothetical protein
MEYFSNLDIKLQTVIISGGISIFVFVAGWIIKILHEKYSLNYKLKREFVFEQQKKIKEEISKTKTPLLLSAESLNYRLWNLLKHRNEKWLELSQDKWLETNHHYLQSFVYKWICLIFWLLKAEKSVGGYDATLSPKSDLLYLKYIKAMKHCLCDRFLIESLEYSSTDVTNHFYIDDLPKFADYVSDNGDVIDFHVFNEKVKSNLKPVQKVFLFFSKFRDDETNKSLNMLIVLHVIVIRFLNTFGHEYQKTEDTKFDDLLKTKYHNMKIIKEFESYLKLHKLEKTFKKTLKKWHNNCL